jgi:hypothetical protein
MKSEVYFIKMDDHEEDEGLGKRIKPFLGRVGLNG